MNEEKFKEFMGRLQELTDELYPPDENQPSMIILVSDGFIVASVNLGCGACLGELATQYGIIAKNAFEHTHTSKEANDTKIMSESMAKDILKN
jgi:hypothetical protein